MPIDYQKAKIYKIVDNTTDNIYVGSTCEPSLARRLAKHVGNYKSHLNENYNYTTSFEIIKNGDYDIILIENFPCNTKDALFARERYWTNELICVNKCRNQGLLLELGKKEYGKQQHKKYYENNVDKITENQKKYYEDNKGYYQMYRENNKDRINLYKNKKSICFCGGKYTYTNKNKHFLSKKHQEYEKQNVIPLDV
jgi:hypothetical protein